MSCNHNSGDTFPLGDTTVNCNATDAHGNTGHASFVVHVVNTTGLAITVPEDMTLTLSGSPTIEADYSATASDLVDGAVDVSCTPASGSMLSLGTTVLSCTAVDAHNNHSTATFHIVVQDISPPVVTPTITGTMCTNGWYVSNVDVSWTVTDP